MDDNYDVSSHGFPEFNKDDNTAFKLSQVDIRQLIRAEIVSLSVGIESLVIATRQGVVRRRFKKSEGFEVIELFSKEESKEGHSAEEVCKTFMDICGYHCVIVTNNYNALYLHYESKVAVPLKLLKGWEITAMAFAVDTSPNTTKNMLIGTSTGQLASYMISSADGEQVAEEKPEIVSQLPGNSAIYGIVYDTYQKKMGKGDGVGYTTLVMVFTVEFCYQFTGSLPFKALFRDSKLSEKIKEHGKRVYHKSLKESELKVFYRLGDNNAVELHSFAWKTELAICHGRFRPKDNFKGHVTISDFALDVYRKKSMAQGQKIEVPEAIGITDLYIFFLYNDSVVTLSRITKQIEYVESFRSEGRMVQMTHEPSTGSLWICSSRKLYRLEVASGDKDVWRQELERSNFVEALRLCRENGGKHYGYVAGMYADSKFRNENYVEAAEYYAISTRSFEEVIVSYLMAKDTEGLEKYLTLKLDSIIDQENLKAQKVLLTTWLLVLKLDKIKRATAMVDDVQTTDTIGSTKKRPTNSELLTTHKLVLELGSFLQERGDCLDTDTVFQLLENNGRGRECVELVKSRSKIEAAVIHYINDNDIRNALKYLVKMKDERKNKIMERYASTFIKHETDLTLKYLRKYFPNMQIEELVPALLNVNKEKRGSVNQFLCESMEESNNQIVSNLYLFFLAESGDQKSHEELLQFIGKQELLKRRNQPLNIDKDFALNVCKYFKRTEAQIKMYGMLEFYEEAVKLALDSDMTDLAKSYANLPSDSKIRKRLWLSILNNVINAHNGSDSILGIIKESRGNLTLGDVFPYISPDVKIGEFSIILLEHLKDHGQKISTLNEEIKEYNINAKDLLGQHKTHQSNLIEFPSDKCCDYCEKLLVNDLKYYVFPCLHGYHMRCLVREQFAQRHYVMKSKQEKQELLESSMTRIKKLLAKFGLPTEEESKVKVIEYVEMLLKEGVVVLGSTKRRVELTPEAYRVLEIYYKQLEELLVGECLMCGSLAVETIDVPFDSYDEFQWAL